MRGGRAQELACEHCSHARCRRGSHNYYAYITLDTSIQVNYLKHLILQIANMLKNIKLES